MKSKTSQQDPVYLKFEHRELLNSKIDILELQRNALKISKSISNYKKLRLNELKLKIRLQRKLKEFERKIKRIQSNTPQLQTPKKTISERTAKLPSRRKKHRDKIELELIEINRKISELLRR